MPGDLFDCHDVCMCVCRTVISSSELRAGMLLNIMQCTRQPPTAKNYLVQFVTSAKVEKADIGIINRVGSGQKCHDFVIQLFHFIVE